MLLKIIKYVVKHIFRVGFCGKFAEKEIIMNENTKDKDCLDPENNSKLCFFKVANAFLLLFVFLLFVVLAWYAPRVIQRQSLGFDYVGVIVAILAILITVLITWQIWITISSKEEVRKATDALEKLRELKLDLDAHKNLFNQRNLEIKHLIDAHAKLLHVEDTADLSIQYLSYAEALELFILSNVDLSYEQIDDTLRELGNILMVFQSTKDPLVAWDFIDSQKQFDHHFYNILNALSKRENDIEEFRKRIIRIKDLRDEYIKIVKESEMGKRVQQIKKEQKEIERELIERTCNKKE